VTDTVAENYRQADLFNDVRRHRFEGSRKLTILTVRVETRGGGFQIHTHTHTQIMSTLSTCSFGFLSCSSEQLSKLLTSYLSQMSKLLRNKSKQNRRKAFSYTAVQIANFVCMCEHFCMLFHV